MKGIIAFSMVGAVVVISAQQATPPQVPPPPTVQGPRPEVPGVHRPTTSTPTVHTPTTQAPTVQAPQVIQPQVATPQQAMPNGEVFQGTWSAAGQRQVLYTEPDHSAATVQLSGAVVLTTGAGLSRGFLGEVLGFDDGAGLIAARVVWTDDRGDKIFSAIYGDALASVTSMLRGTISGGTGRYRGITGEYEFRWQHLVNTDDDVVTGRAVDLRGRVRATGGTQ